MRNNYVSILGHIGKCEERVMSDGGYLYSMSMAYSQTKKGPDGQWTSTPHWFRVAFFSKTKKDLKKGMLVMVVGSLAEHKYNGASYISIRADQVWPVVVATRRAEKPAEDDEVDIPSDPSAYGEDNDGSEEVPF